VTGIPGQTIRELLTDAVSDVEPDHRLSEIQARTARPDRRPRWYVTGGAVLATAAAVTTFAVVTNLDTDDATDPDPAPTGTPTAIEVRAVPAYYIGATPNGPRLFREFANVDASIRKLDASLSLLESGAADPDYTTAWGPDSFDAASVQGDVIYVDLADESLHDRPKGMSVVEAQLALQQAIYTVQGAAQQGRLPVQFRLNGNPINTVYGETTSEPVGELPPLDVLALVSISDPAEGTVVRDSFHAEGVASSYEATVNWEIRDVDGFVVHRGYTTAKGYTDKLWPWETEIDVSDLEPGTYTFVALTADGSGGAEGFEPTSDTRTIVVE
jgi:hypothetical protein